MKAGVHPRYEPMAFRDRSTGTVLITRSTRIPEEMIEVDGVRYPVIHVTAASHPFWTGTARTLDTEGRIQAFHRRYGRAQATGGPSRRVATGDAPGGARS